MPIACHVCGFEYPQYQAYLNHLFDASCTQQQQKQQHSPTSVSTSAAIEKKKKEIQVHHVWTNLCPHFATATQSKSISLDDFLFDEASLATLKVELTSVVAGLLGEGQLTALGYPDKDIFHILEVLLNMAGCRGAKEECNSACSRLETVLNPTQLKYRRLKAQLAASRVNSLKLLEICLPDQKLWRRNNWTDKAIETILAEIITQARKEASIVMIE